MVGREGGGGIKQVREPAIMVGFGTSKKIRTFPFTHRKLQSHCTFPTGFKWCVADRITTGGSQLQHYGSHFMVSKSE